MHGSVVCRVALYCIRLNERDCKGGSLWDKEWLTYESTILLLHSQTHMHWPHKTRMNGRDRKKGGNGERRKKTINETGGEDGEMEALRERKG